MNETIFRWINNWPDELELLFLVLSEGHRFPFFEVALIGVLIFGAYRNGRKGWIGVLAALLAIAAANETCDFLKHYVQELRPCVELSGVVIRVEKLNTFGTASSHAANTAALAAGLMWMWGPNAKYWAMLPFLVGLSRIYVGVHYPSQVLLGWCIGIVFGTVFVMLFSKLFRIGNGDRARIETPVQT